jgi:hypothetical protein
LLLLKLDEEDVGVELGHDVGAELLLLELDEEEDDVRAELGHDIGAELLLHELDEKDDVGVELLLLKFNEEEDVEAKLGRDGGYVRAELGAQVRGKRRKRRETGAAGSDQFSGAVWFRISHIYSLMGDRPAPGSPAKQL